MLFVVIYVSSLSSQTVQRDKVILEITTGTDCGSCPGAAVGAEELINNGASIAVIEYHNYNSDDPFNNTDAAARWDYYGFFGCPLSKFDGDLLFVGGSYDGSNYDDFLPLYNERIAIPSDFLIKINGFRLDDLKYKFDIQIKNVNNNTDDKLYLQVALTESNIPYSWQSQNVMNFVERKMYPNANGTLLDFSSKDSLNFSFDVLLEQDWVPENCQLIAFVQNNNTKEILQGSLLDFDNISAINNEVSDENNLKVYPNPVNINHINILIENFSQDKTQVEIYDLHGKKVLSRPFVSDNAGANLMELDISSLKNGIYFINVKYDDKNYIRKIIVDSFLSK